MKVPRTGAKAFEQCAGFLRIAGGENPLDNTAVHPESYGIVQQMAKDLSCTVPQLIADKSLRTRIEMEKYITPTVGLPTLNDILQELDKPGTLTRAIPSSRYLSSTVTAYHQRPPRRDDSTRYCQQHHQLRSFCRYRHQGERACPSLPACQPIHHRSHRSGLHSSARHSESIEHRPRTETDTVDDEGGVNRFKIIKSPGLPSGDS